MTKIATGSKPYARAVSLGAWLAAIAACSGDQRARTAADAAVLVQDASQDAGTHAPVLSWQRTTVEVGVDAVTPPQLLELSQPAGMIAIRVFADPYDSDHAPCFQLEDVVANGDVSWVSTATADDYGDYCLHCEQRVSVASGYGLYVLPSSVDAGLLLEQLRLRVALRDCATLTPVRAQDARPDRLAIEHVTWDPAPSDRRLRLQVPVIVASDHAFADPKLLAAALESLRTIWTAADIAIDTGPVIQIEAASAPLVYSANDRSALLRVARAARGALEQRAIDRIWPAVVITPCLRREDVVTGGRSEPLSMTPHIPSGPGVFDEPDMIFVAAERCTGLEAAPSFDDAATLGAVIAHELGHYLGLYHVVEADGRNDVLADTTADQRNLMRAIPAASATVLTPSQMGIARHHLVFADSHTQSP